ncbi:PRC-barrel domain-containing protein [Sulfitobacter sp. 1A13353]|uniref:PRC-barrel domain-containing protein n=1 Tax=Sulfitobacter sp. 1A13353 TaxID=3368568 RepID=UPI0037470741
MKMLTASTLALTLAGTTAFAEAHMTDPAKVDSMQMNEMKGDLIRSRDITGGVIFTVNDPDGEWHSNTAYNAVDEGWNEIGEIEDIVLSKDGQMVGIVAEVGGFLDIGDKHVMISTPDVNLVAVDDQTYAYVTRLSEEELEALPSVDEGFWD